MKTIIIYALTALMIFSIVGANFFNKSDMSRTLVIQATSSISQSNLSQSAQIISNRLKSFSNEKFDIDIVPERNEIQVKLSDRWDLKTAEVLSLQMGKLEFFNTYNYKSLKELLNGDEHLFNLFNGVPASDSSVRIGCASASNFEKINEYINSGKLGERYAYAWGAPSDGSGMCLYALKLPENSYTSVSGADVETLKYNFESTINNYSINIKFKDSTKETWSRMTKNSIGEAIAIVLDGYVVSAPIIRAGIENGNCSITGNFTEKEIKYIVAIAGNGELPAKFKVVN